MVLNEIEVGLNHHSLINDEETKKRYKELLAVVREEYEDILKGEVQRAISRRRRRHQAPGRQLHRERQGLHAEAARPQQVHRARRGAG